MKLKNNFIKLTKETRLYNLEIPILSITGGISTGKSSVARMLKDLGHAVISADQLVKDIYSQIETIEFVKLTCPEVVNNSNINFQILREIFFKNESLKLKIEHWIYPRLKDAFISKLNELKNPTHLFYEVPLLYERQLHANFDLNILVYANQETQIKRVIQRDNVTEDSARRVLSSQMDIEAKLGFADVIIKNEDDIKKLKEEVETFLLKYFE